MSRGSTVKIWRRTLDELLAAECFDQALIAQESLIKALIEEDAPAKDIPDELIEVLCTPLHDLVYGLQLLRPLHAARIRCTVQLVQKSEHEILLIPGVGRRLVSLRDRLANYGLRFGMRLTRGMLQRWQDRRLQKQRG